MTAVLLAALAVQPGPDGGDLEQFRALLAEAEAAYSAAESVTRTAMTGRDGTTNPRWERVQTTAGLSSRTTSTTLPPHGARHRPDSSAWGANPVYQFSLRHAGDRWRLDEVRPPAGRGPPMYHDLQLPFAVDDLTYREALGRPDARPRFRPAVQWRGKPHAEWWFEADYVGVVVRGYALLLDPARPGLVRGVRMHEPATAAEPTYEYRLDYTESADRWPPPARYESSWDDPAKTPRGPRVYHREEVVSYRRLDPPPPASAFTVSAFGLPEPEPDPLTFMRFERPADPDARGDKPTQRPDPNDTWQWWAVGGILLVGAVAFVLAGRRKP